MPASPIRRLALWACVAALLPLSAAAQEAAGAAPDARARPAADPRNAGPYLAARIAGAEGDYAEAATWYNRALLADPANPALLEGAIVAQIGLGRLDEAATVARQMLALGEPNQPAFLAVLAAQAKAGEWDAILADGAAGRSIANLLDGLVAAWAQVGAGRMAEALAAFDRLAATPGLGVFASYHKALALASVGDFEGADAILAGPQGAQIATLRRAVLAHAQILSQLERNADAVALIDRLAVPGQDPGLDALRARLDAGETVAFDMARGAGDGVAEAFYTLANALVGETDDAYTLLFARAAAYLRPDHTEAVLLTAGLLGRLGQNALATEAYAAIPATDPSYPIAEMGRAEALYDAGSAEASIEVLQALARSHPQMIQVHRALGDALRRAERFGDAVTAYDAAVALAAALPDEAQDWGLYYARGIALEREDRWPEAEADFRRALALEPDQPQVLNYLGYSMVEMGINLDEALALIERAVRAEPDSGYIVDSFAWALFKLGRYDEAVAPMERASLLEPVDPVVTDHLGDVYWVVGRTREAEFQWQRALSYDPEPEEAARIRRKLEVGLDAVLAEEAASAPAPVEAADGN